MSDSKKKGNDGQTKKPAEGKKPTSHKGPSKGTRSDARKKGKRVSYVVVPKGKRLHSNIISKLESENFKYTIARAVDVAKKYQRFVSVDNPEEFPSMSKDEQKWTQAQINIDEEARKETQRIQRLMAREEKRRRRLKEAEKEELHRRKYRVHPDDRYYKYIEGYQKRRHRITKKRFMKCVDMPLFKEVLKRNVELNESPLWNDNLNLQNLTFTEARKLKEHLQQFEVIVEALKQGIFDKPGCDDIPIDKVKRRWSKHDMSRKNYRKSKFTPETLQPVKIKKSERLADKNKKKKKTKRRKIFPPYLHPPPVTEERESSPIEAPATTWLEKVAAWLKGTDTNNEKNQKSETTPKKKLMFEEPKNRSKSMSKQKSKPKGVNKPTGKQSSQPEKNVDTPPDDDDTKEKHPYADYITIKIPTDLAQRKKFIHTLVQRKDTKQIGEVKDRNQAIHEEREKAKKHHEFWYENKDEPLQMLHRDEQDSDVWTVTTTTTTDSYASWRRLPDITHISKKMENLASPIDNTLAFRLLLLLFVLWEIGMFVRKRVDDVYYNIFTFYLIRENIWHYQPGAFAPIEVPIFLAVQEYSHVFISVMSLSIIHRKNECISILFAFSLMIDGACKMGTASHDLLAVPEPMNWGGVALNGLHLLWKSFAICLFVGYHYYSAGYIRKAREFKHRKTMMHNHEINVKGTKGLQKRKIAWNWMVRHARITNLRKLKQKHPNIKDDNYPKDVLEKEINFCEEKELRLYAQRHNLNIGYPHNRLKDMKRYVFGELEKSDYTEADEEEGSSKSRKNREKVKRKSSKAITFENWRHWLSEKRESRQMPRRSNKVLPSHAANSLKNIKSSKRSIRESLYATAIINNA